MMVISSLLAGNMRKPPPAISIRQGIAPPRNTPRNKVVNPLMTNCVRREAGRVSWPSITPQPSLLGDGHGPDKHRHHQPQHPKNGGEDFTRRLPRKLVIAPQNDDADMQNQQHGRAQQADLLQLDFLLDERGHRAAPADFFNRSRARAKNFQLGQGDDSTGPAPRPAPRKKASGQIKIRPRNTAR